MPVLMLDNYLKTTGGNVSRMAREVGMSRQRVEYYRTHSTMVVYVDYELKTGVINKVSAIKEKILYIKGESNEQA